MRNWNVIYANEILDEGIVLSLPMRNWNLLKGADLLPSISVLSLPMRNWNPLVPVFDRVRRPCSQPTYEELKQLHQYSCRQLNNGSQPTYEELKQVSLNLSRPNSSCSQPTYEELKRHIAVPLQREGQGFSAYLWGIETRQNRCPGREKWCSQPTYEELKPELTSRLFTQVELVLSLPMRNWNLFPFRPLIYRHNRSQPTYEELKQPSAALKSTTFTRSQPTYEELKL